MHFIYDGDNNNEEFFSNTLWPAPSEWMMELS
jgi:hypothetical protein